MDNGGHGGLGMSASLQRVCGVTCESIIIYLIIAVEMYSSVAAIYYIFGQSYLVNIRGIFSDCEVYIMGMKYIY